MHAFFIFWTVHTARYFDSRMPRKDKLNYNQTEQLIILVEWQPHIYNLSHEEYKDIIFLA